MTNKPFRILLADDDDDDAFLFREALEEIPLKTELSVASNGMELMNAVNSKTYKPDIIFLDMNMPVKNGLECLEEIRIKPGFESLPIIILSTSIARYLWESACERGANLYIQKPTSFVGLVDILKKCLLQHPKTGDDLKMEQFLITN
jgi:CheY-like chemotaxis protein